MSPSQNVLWAPKGDGDGNTNDEQSFAKKGGFVKSDLILYDSSDSEKDVCAICLEVYKEGDKICWSHNLSCNHHFHAQCGIAWLAKHSQCPVCRAEYLVSPANDNNV